MLRLGFAKVYRIDVRNVTVVLIFFLNNYNITFGWSQNNLYILDIMVFIKLYIWTYFFVRTQNCVTKFMFVWDFYEFRTSLQIKWGKHLGIKGHIRYKNMFTYSEYYGLPL